DPPISGRGSNRCLHETLGASGRLAVLRNIENHGRARASTPTPTIGRRNYRGYNATSGQRVSDGEHDRIDRFAGERARYMTESKSAPHPKPIVGFTAGVYDLFHIGHLRILQNAAGLCDRLIVGVSTDELVAYKGKAPVIPFTERMEIVRSVREV